MAGRNKLKYTVMSALFAALMIVGAYIKIPVGPVPIVLTNLFVILAGVVLGPLWGMASVALYLLLGLMGMPVFSGGGGPGYFAGPTGGYLIGYLLGAGAAGLINKIGSLKIVWSSIAVLLGFVCIYLTGVPWLKIVLAMPWPGALSAGLIPFIIGDAVKGGIIVALYVTLHKTAPDIIPSGTK